MKQSEYANFGFSGDFMILMEKKTYSRTDSGKSWKRKPDDVIRNVFTPEHYNNFLSFVPFFRERVEKSYTAAGYLPVRVTSTRPDGQVKSVATFLFLARSDMESAAGWLEKEVMNHAKTWESKSTFEKRKSASGHDFNVYRHYITLINPDETGVTHSATYEENTHTWH